MSKFKIYLTFGCLLSIIAIVFVLYAVNNPQASFPWNNSVTFAIYGAYGIIISLIWGLVFKHKPKQTK